MARTLDTFIADLDGTSDEITTFTVDENDCWIWAGGSSGSGYPEVADATQRKPLYAHRVACEHDGGPIPPGKDFHVHHICGVKSCVNPEHLIVLNKTAHNAITSIQLRQQTHCRSGRHSWTAENIGIVGSKKRRYCKACKFEYEHTPKRLKSRAKSEAKRRKRRANEFRHRNLFRASFAQRQRADIPGRQV